MEGSATGRILAVNDRVFNAKRFIRSYQRYAAVKNRFREFRAKFFIVFMAITGNAAKNQRKQGLEQQAGMTQLLVFSLASTSIVLLSATWDGAVERSSSPLTPSLKPLTALPRSDPMLPSFLVPNTSMIITSTISQCQILNEPISLLLIGQLS